MSPTGNSSNHSTLKVVEWTTGLIGLAMLGIVLIKATMIGFYDSDAPWMFLVGGIGGALIIVSQLLEKWLD